MLAFARQQGVTAFWAASPNTQAGDVRMHWPTEGGENLLVRQGESRCILVSSGVGPQERMYARSRPCDAKLASGILTVAAAAAPPPPPGAATGTGTTPRSRRRRRPRSSAPRSSSTCATRCARASRPSAAAGSRAPCTRPSAWPWPTRWASGSPCTARAWSRPFASARLLALVQGRVARGRRRRRLPGVFLGDGLRAGLVLGLFAARVPTGARLRHPTAVYDKTLRARAAQWWPAAPALAAAAAAAADVGRQAAAAQAAAAGALPRAARQGRRAGLGPGLRHGLVRAVPRRGRRLRARLRHGRRAAGVDRAVRGARGRARVLPGLPVRRAEWRPLPVLAARHGARVQRLQPEALQVCRDALLRVRQPGLAAAARVRAAAADGLHRGLSRLPEP